MSPFLIITLSTISNGSGGSLTLVDPPLFSASAGSTSTTLAASGVASFTAQYTISQAAANTGSVNNTITVTASSPGQSNDVTDVSDDGIDDDGNTVDESTVILTTTDISIEVTKSSSVVDNNSNGKTDQGDLINYTIIIRNTGNVNLTGLNLSDVLTDGNGGSLSLNASPTFVSASAGSTSLTIESGDTVTYSAAYTISGAAANAGSIINRATVVSKSGQTIDVTDTSDDPNTGAANDATVVNITPMPDMEVTKTVTVIENGDGSLGIGDTVKYTISIENKGNVDLTSLVISDTFVDMASSTLALATTPTFDFADLGSSEGTIAPDETAYYVATYIIDQSSVDIGGVINSVMITASSTGGVVSDTSDDGIDTDGNTTDDVTVLTIDPNPIIEATKTAVVSDVNSNGINDLGDIITYTITVENKGNVTLSGLTISDTLTDGNDASLTLTSPPIVSSILNTYGINVTALNASNYTLAGNDRIGSVNGNDVGVTINFGDIIEFNVNAAGHPFYIKNTQGAGVNNLVNGVENNGSESGTVRWKPTSTGIYYYRCSIHNAMYGIIKVENSLAVGGVVTYTATFNIDQQAVDSGRVINSALAIASNPSKTSDVSDRSDNGDDTDGNTTNDETIINTSAIPAITVIKEVSSITDVNSNKFDRSRR